MKTNLVMGATLFYITANAVGQTITALSPEVHSFHTPMVLEYTLDRFLSENTVPPYRHSPMDVTDFRNYSCRGVTLERVTLELTRFDKETFRSLRIESQLFNNSGKDKLVTLTVAVVKASDVVSTGALKGLRVQQGSFAQAGRGQPESPQELTVRIPDGEPYPKLRITVTAVDY
jgi:hypothetical protein